MEERPVSEGWLDLFPQLARLEPEARQALLAAAGEVRLPQGAVVFAPGDECENYLLVLEGVVRVQQIGEGGREIVLYRVCAGETCVLTTASLLARAVYAAEGIAETPVRAMAVPAAAFQQLLASSPIFRTFVFSTYGERLVQLMRVVEDVAFRRIDARLAERLLQRADAAGRITATHDELAVELGTVREVVSRKLKSFERHGWLRASRGAIELLDPDALRQLGERSSM